jgi:hypothetical protein
MHLPFLPNSNQSMQASRRHYWVGQIGGITATASQGNAGGSKRNSTPGIAAPSLLLLLLAFCNFSQAVCCLFPFTPKVHARLYPQGSSLLKYKSDLLNPETMIYFNTLLNTALGTGPQIRKALYPEPSSIRKDQRWFFLCIFRTLPGLNFAAMENWNLPHFGRYSFQTQQSIFCIFASFFTFYQFLSLSIQGSRKKNHHWSLRRGRLKSVRVYFQTLPL